MNDDEISQLNKNPPVEPAAPVVVKARLGVRDFQTGGVKWLVPGDQTDPSNP